jgi:predicted nucleotidyltransferase
MAQTGTDSGDGLREQLVAVLDDHPVRVGFLFGSRARGEFHERSDVDVAVVFDGLEPGDPGYNDVLFDLGADLAVELGTDDVDVVDLRRAPASLVRTVFEDGTVLVGDEDDVRSLQDELFTGSDDETRPPADRFDAVLAAIDDHLA